MAVSVTLGAGCMPSAPSLAVQGFSCSPQAGVEAIPAPGAARYLAGRFHVHVVDQRGVWSPPLTRLDLELVPRSPGGSDTTQFRYPILGTARFLDAPDSVATTVVTGSRLAAVGRSLFIGDLNFTDAVGLSLEIRRLEERMFSGTWRSSNGFAVWIGPDGRPLPNAAGYFCAERIADTARSPALRAG